MRFADMANDAIKLAQEEAYWRQRLAVDAAHLLLGIFGVDTSFAIMFEENGLTWGKASQDVDDFVKNHIGVTSTNDLSQPDCTAEVQDLLKNASELAQFSNSEMVASDHLLLLLVDLESVPSLFQDKWGVSKSLIKEHAHRGLLGLVEKNKRTRQYRITVAKRYIEILSYRELNSSTLAQKSQIKDLIKFRHQWEEELATLCGRRD